MSRFQRQRKTTANLIEHFEEVPTSKPRHLDSDLLLPSSSPESGVGAAEVQGPPVYAFWIVLGCGLLLVVVILVGGWILAKKKGYFYL